MSDRGLIREGTMTIQRFFLMNLSEVPKLLIFHPIVSHAFLWNWKVLVALSRTLGESPFCRLCDDSTPNPTKLARISLEGAPKSASGIAHSCPHIVSRRTTVGLYVWRRKCSVSSRAGPYGGFFTPSHALVHGIEGIPMSSTGRVNEVDARIQSLGSE